jgi:tRNA pseudouridine13 synthase
MNQPVLKERASDFLVSESLVLPAQTGASGRYRYLKLRKCGYTTFEAVERIAAAFGVERQNVLYAGLKDEEGITEQLVAVDATLKHEDLLDFNRLQRGAGPAFLELAPSGCGDEPIEIGGLSGNSFRIVVRNLCASRAEAFRRKPKHTFFFLNYYDSQRFGIPGHPKTTHLIGRALLRNDYGAALRWLVESGTKEGRSASQHVGDPATFFARLEPRIQSFYQCASASHDWNARLAQMTRDACGGDLWTHESEGHSWVFPLRQRGVLDLLSQGHELPYDNYRARQGQIVMVHSSRPTAVQAHVQILACAVEDARPGRFHCEMSFFLPSGCYATMCVRQFVACPCQSGSAACAAS